MNTPNRSTLIAKLQKTLKKHYKPVATPDRSLLEHLLYACCLENSPFDKADEAFAQLQQAYFDWNEVRVTSATELAEVFNALPQPQGAAQRIKKVLQGMFDVIYGFDLEPLKKQNLGKSIKDIEKFGATPFAVAYVTQNGLNGHAIAIDEGAYDILVIVGILTEAEAAKGLLPGIERAIPKNKGNEFFAELHQFAADFFASPTSQRMKNLLAELAPDAKDRIAARLARKQVMASDNAKAARKERIAAREAAEAALQAPHKAAPKPAETAKAPPAKETKSKSPAKPPEPPKGAAAKKPGKAVEPPPKKKAEATRAPEPKKKADEAKKPVSKGLAKKKPR